ncbi:uncharacterized protein YALI1_F24511g [Yarrowia lipolytica]|uniref:Uncharacterized protein n=1 Tax=Yarrowia lipolytica TaxID=4952 RepID=A0A1D8NP03_YARLL|nr:hypothetical protein YALI1_F24511g [Yarrowia lipolytica]
MKTYLGATGSQTFIIISYCRQGGGAPEQVVNTKQVVFIDLQSPYRVPRSETSLLSFRLSISRRISIVLLCLQATHKP